MGVVGRQGVVAKRLKGEKNRRGRIGRDIGVLLREKNKLEGEGQGETEGIWKRGGWVRENY
jgi:hypothetical protein